MPSGCGPLAIENGRRLSSSSSTSTYWPLKRLSGRSPGAGSRRRPITPSASRHFSVTTTSSWRRAMRSEEHTSELQSLMRISYAVFCLKKKKNKQKQQKMTINTYRKHANTKSQHTNKIEHQN